MKKYIKYLFTILLPLFILVGLRGLYQSNKASLNPEPMPSPLPIPKLVIPHDTLIKSDINDMKKLIKVYDEEKKIMLESSKPTTPEMEKKTKKNQQTIQPFDKIKSH